MIRKLKFMFGLFYTQYPFSKVGGEANKSHDHET